MSAALTDVDEDMGTVSRAFADATGRRDEPPGSRMWISVGVPVVCASRGIRSASGKMMLFRSFSFSPFASRKTGWPTHCFTAVKRYLDSLSRLCRLLHLLPDMFRQLDQMSGLQLVRAAPYRQSPAFRKRHDVDGGRGMCVRLRVDWRDGDIFERCFSAIDIGLSRKRNCCDETGFES